MAAASLVKYLYLAHFSRPEAERRLYRTIRRLGAASIVEIGVGTGRRAARMIQVARRYTRVGSVKYTGIDLFEARSAETPGPTLKQFHQLLSTSGARVRLVPGDPFGALARAANELTGTDLLVIAAGHDAELLARAWFYVPRLLHPRSQVLVEQRGPEPDAEPTYQLLPLSQVQYLAKVSAPRRAA